jgi:hypothetical protein
MTATDRDTSGSNAAPSSWSGWTVSVSAPAVKADRQQQDQRRHLQPAGNHLAADGQHERQSDPDQDLVGGHRGPSPVRRTLRDSSSHPRSTVLITASHRPDVRPPTVE